MARDVRAMPAPGADPFAATALLDLADSAPAVVPESGRSGPAPVAPVGSATPSQIVFIEANVPDAQNLIDGLQPGVQAVLRKPERDGVQQIAA